MDPTYSTFSFVTEEGDGLETYTQKLEISQNTANQAEIERKIQDAVNKRHLDKLNELLQQHPHYQTYYHMQKNVLGPKVDLRLDHSWGMTSLHWAAISGDTARLRDAIATEEHLSINTLDSFSDTPLQLASRNGYSECMKLLLEKGCDVNIAGNWSRKPLHEVAENGHLAAAVMIIERGSALDSVTSIGNTPLLLACMHGHLDIAKLLISRNVKLSIQNSDGQTALHKACQNDNVECAQLLIDNGADFEAKDNDHQTPLIVAAKFGSLDCLKLLVDMNCDINAYDLNKATGLHLAARGGFIDCTKALIDGANANVTARDVLRNTPLIEASFNGHYAVVNFLVQLKCSTVEDVNNVNFSGRTALHQAVLNGHVNVTRVLLEHGASPLTMDKSTNTPTQLYRSMTGTRVPFNARVAGRPLLFNSKKGRAPIHDASENGHAECVKLLLRYDADGNSRDFDGRTPLILATTKGHADVARVLLDQKVNIDSVDRVFRTALHQAAFHEAFDCVRLLLEAGASVNTRDSQGDTAIIIASRRGFHQIVHQLIQSNCDTAVRNNGGRNALHEACVEGHKDCVTILLTSNTDIDKGDFYRDTALVLAARKGHTEIVNILMESGADVNRVCSYGRTALHGAVANSDFECCRRLLEAGANPNIKDADGRTPLLSAFDFVKLTPRRIEVIKLLIIFNSDVDTNGPLNGKMCCPLEVALERQSLPAIQILTFSGCDLSLVTLLDTEFENVSIFGSGKSMPVYSWIKTYKSRPPMLRYICRTEIRHHLGYNVKRDVERIFLPQVLKDFLCMDDLQGI